MCFRCRSRDEYVDIRTRLTPDDIGTLLVEDIIGDGQISTILLSRPYLFEEWGVEILKPRATRACCTKSTEPWSYSWNDYRPSPACACSCSLQLNICDVSESCFESHLRLVRLIGTVGLLHRFLLYIYLIVSITGIIIIVIIKDSGEDDDDDDDDDDHHHHHPLYRCFVI